MWENENPLLVNKLSIDDVWQSRGTLPKTINEGDGIAHYDEWKMVDGAIVRVVREQYANWGGAHEALALRLKGSRSICQRGRMEEGSNLYADPEGTSSRVIALFDQNQSKHVEIITAIECDEQPCSILEVFQASSLAHALAMESV